MKLDVARLCLDCEDVHGDQQCPSCGSEVFAFLTRWIPPAAEPRTDRPRPRQAAAPSLTPPEQVEAYRQLLEGHPRRGNIVAKSMLGLAAFSLAGWAWQASSKGKGRREKGKEQEHKEEL